MTHTVADQFAATLEAAGVRRICMALSATALPSFAGRDATARILNFLRWEIGLRRRWCIPCAARSLSRGRIHSM